MRSLYTKFVVTTLGIMVLSFITAFLISNMYYQQYLKPQNDEKNTGIAMEIADFIENEPALDADRYLENISEIGYQIYMVSENGNQSFYGADFRETFLSTDVIESTIDGQIYHGMRDFPKETFVTGFFANELENTIGIPVVYQNERHAVFIRPDIKLLFDEMHLLFGILFILTIIFSILFVIVGTRFLVSPVTKLSKATEKVPEGKYHFDNLPVTRKDEIGHLSRNFADMAVRIEENERMRKDFISNVSHDIASPLSNIKGYVSLLERSDITEKDSKTFLSVINEEASRISEMSKQLLILSSLDHDSHIMTIETLNVSKQIESLLHKYEWRLNDKKMMLSYVLEPAEIEADKALLNMVWDNILSNALKYTEAGGNIEITAGVDEGECFVTISDTGIGIDEKLKGKVFERFYRVDDARSNNVEGTGLGLAIVKDIIDMHKGDISVESDDGGTTFIIKLPLLLR